MICMELWFIKEVPQVAVTTIPIVKLKWPPIILKLTSREMENGMSAMTVISRQYQINKL